MATASRVGRAVPSAILPRKRSWKKKRRERERGSGKFSCVAPDSDGVVRTDMVDEVRPSWISCKAERISSRQFQRLVDDYGNEKDLIMAGRIEHTTGTLPSAKHPETHGSIKVW